jgi:DNA gyrase inhibitor GyrI
MGHSQVGEIHHVCLAPVACTIVDSNQKNGNMKKLLVVIVFILLVGILYLSMNGVFRAVEIREDVMPGYRIMGIEHRGRYEKIGGAFERIRQLSDSSGVPLKMIGIYYDNPEKVQDDSLRSVAGLIVSTEDSARLAAKGGLVAITIPSGPAAVVDFNTEGKVSMIIGAMKAYPALTKYMETSSKAESIQFVYEVYGEKSTRYVMQYAP